MLLSIDFILYTEYDSISLTPSKSYTNFFDYDSPEIGDSQDSGFFAKAPNKSSFTIDVDTWINDNIFLAVNDKTNRFSKYICRLVEDDNSFWDGLIDIGQLSYNATKTKLSFTIYDFTILLNEISDFKIDFSESTMDFADVSLTIENNSIDLYEDFSSNNVSVDFLTAFAEMNYFEGHPSITKDAWYSVDYDNNYDYGIVKSYLNQNIYFVKTPKDRSSSGLKTVYYSSCFLPKATGTITYNNGNEYYWNVTQGSGFRTPFQKYVIKSNIIYWVEITESLVNVYSYEMQQLLTSSFYLQAVTSAYVTDEVLLPECTFDINGTHIKDQKWGASERRIEFFNITSGNTLTIDTYMSNPVSYINNNLYNNHYDRVYVVENTNNTVTITLLQIILIYGQWGYDGEPSGASETIAISYQLESIMGGLNTISNSRIYYNWEVISSADVSNISSPTFQSWVSSYLAANFNYSPLTNATGIFTDTLGNKYYYQNNMYSTSGNYDYYDYYFRPAMIRKYTGFTASYYTTWALAELTFKDILATLSYVNNMMLYGDGKLNINFLSRGNTGTITPVATGIIDDDMIDLQIERLQEEYSDVATKNIAIVNLDIIINDYYKSFYSTIKYKGSLDVSSIFKTPVYNIGMFNTLTTNGIPFQIIKYKKITDNIYKLDLLHDNFVQIAEVDIAGTLGNWTVLTGIMVTEENVTVRVV